MQTYYYKDASGAIFHSRSPAIPPGCIRHVQGHLEDGQAVRVQFDMMDAMQQDIARHHPAAKVALFDAAGPTRISDESTMAAALAAAPASTRDIAFKVEQTMLAAQGARDAGMPLRHHVDQLHDLARTYGAHGFLAGDPGKAACELAAQSITGAARAFEAVSNG